MNHGLRVTRHSVRGTFQSIFFYRLGSTVGFFETIIKKRETLTFFISKASLSNVINSNIVSLWMIPSALPFTEYVDLMFDFRDYKGTINHKCVHSQVIFLFRIFSFILWNRFQETIFYYSNTKFSSDRVWDFLLLFRLIICLKQDSKFLAIYCKLHWSVNLETWF